MDTKTTWNKIIESKLKEGQSINDLYTEYDSGIVMVPNIVAEEVSNLTHQLQNVKPWINMATVKGSNSSDINVLVLQALNQGANGLNLVLDSPMCVVDALDSVLTEYLDVRIDCAAWTAEDILKEKNKLDSTKYPNVRWVGAENISEFQIPAIDRVSNIKRLLTELDGEGQIDIIVSLSKNLLFEIASLRALRILLAKNGIMSYNLIARYDVEGTNELGDYNLIEKTYKTMSGVLGCADAVLTHYIGDEESRLTLNIHNVLELESGFKDVMDPIGGAYYVEKLVSEIVDKVAG